MDNCECAGKMKLLRMETVGKFIRMRSAFERMINPIMQQCGLTPVLAITLDLISRQKGATVSTVFKTLGLNQGNVSSMCKKLENEGYICRRRNARDERSVVLEITARGTAALENIEQELRRYSYLCETLTAADLLAAAAGIDALARLSEKIERAISERSGTAHA